MKSRRNDKAARLRFQSRRLPRIESLEQRQLLTAAAIAQSDISGGSLAAPTIGLPTMQAPFGDTGPGYNLTGIWVSDPTSQQLTVTLTLQHGTLSFGGFESSDPNLATATSTGFILPQGVTIEGSGTSTLTLIGTEQQIYQLLTNGIKQKSDNGEVSFGLPSIGSPPDPFQNDGGYVYTNTGLQYTPGSGFSGTDPLTVTAFGTSSGSASPTATSTLLLEARPNSSYSGPILTSLSDVYVNGNTGTIVFNNAAPSTLVTNPTQTTGITISDPAAGNSLIEVAISDTYGTLKLATTQGLTFVAGANDSSSMTLRDSVADINDALNGMSYTLPASGVTTSSIMPNGGSPFDNITVEANDLGHNAVGAPLDSHTTIAVYAAPLTTPIAAYVDPGSSVVFNSANGNALGVYYTNSDKLDLNLSVDLGTLTLGSSAGITFVGGGNGQGSMTIEGTASALNKALAGLTYTPNALPNTLSSTSDTLYAKLSDPSLGAPNEGDLVGQGAMSIYIQPGGPPTASAAGGIEMPAVQSTGMGVPVTFSPTNGNAISLDDPDDSASGRTITTSIYVSNGNLTLAPSPGLTVTAITAGSDDGTGWILQGTVAQVNAALDGMVYTPVAGFAGVDSLIVYASPNGSELFTNAPGANISNVGIVVGAMSQGIGIGAPIAPQNASSIAPVVFSPATGNAISLTNPGIGSQAQVQVTVSVGGTGSLQLAGTSNITLVSGANGGTSLTIEGTIASLNAALDGLTYTPGSGDVGWTELDITASVPGDSAIPINGTSTLIQDFLAAAPGLISVPAGQMFNAAGPVVFSSGNQNAIAINDPAAGNQQVQVTLSLQSGSQGTLTLGSTAGVSFVPGMGANGTTSMTITGTVAAINRALSGSSYVNAATNENDQLTITLDDTGPGGPRTSVGSVSLQPGNSHVGPPALWTGSYLEISVGSPQNPTLFPAPVVTLPAGPIAATGTPVAVSGVSVAGAALVQVSLSASHGTLSAPATAGVMIQTVQDNGTPTLELSGTLAAINAALAQLTYTGSAGYTGTDTLSVSAVAVSELSPPADLLNSPSLYPNNPPASSGVSPAGSSISLNAGSTSGSSLIVTQPSVTAIPVDSASIQIPNSNTFISPESVATVDTVTLNVSPPSINVPAGQKISGSLPLVFSSADGNGITITDAAVGANPVQVTLSVASGTLTLANTAGLTFIAGNGSGNATMTFTGSVTDIANALDGLSYAAGSGFTGTDTLNVGFSDLGNGGDSGSPITLSNSVAIHVTAAVPQKVTLSLPTGPVAVNYFDEPYVGGTSVPGVQVSESGQGIIQLTLSVQNGTLNVTFFGGDKITGGGTSTLTLTGTALEINESLNPKGYFTPAPSPLQQLLPIPFTPPISTQGIPIPVGLIYTPNAGFYGTDTLSASAKAVGLANAPVSSGTVTLDVTSTPWVSVDGSAASYTPGGSPFAFVSYVSISAAQPQLSGATLTISPATLQAGDTLSFTSTGGITGNYANGVLTLTGNVSPADYQAVLQSLTFSSTSSSTTTRVMSVTVSAGALTSSLSTCAGVTVSSGTDSGNGSPTGNVQHGNHQTAPVNSLVSRYSNHGLSGDSQTSGGLQTSTGGFNYVPPSPPAPLSTGGSSGGSSAGGTSNSGGDKKSFAPVDQAFAQLNPEDFFL